MCLIVYAPTYACGCVAPRHLKVSLFRCQWSGVAIPVYTGYKQAGPDFTWYATCATTNSVTIQLQLPFLCDDCDRAANTDDGKGEKLMIGRVCRHNKAKILKIDQHVLSNPDSLVNEGFPNAVVVLGTIRALLDQLLKFHPRSLWNMTRDQRPVVDHADAIKRWSELFVPMPLDVDPTYCWPLSAIPDGQFPSSPSKKTASSTTSDISNLTSSLSTLNIITEAWQRPADYQPPPTPIPSSSSPEQEEYPQQLLQPEAADWSEDPTAKSDDEEWLANGVQELMGRWKISEERK